MVAYGGWPQKCWPTDACSVMQVWFSVSQMHAAAMHSMHSGTTDGESMPNPMAFKEQVEELKVRLKAFEEFGDYLIPGKRDPRRYREDAADAIGQKIEQWVAAAQPKPDAGIKKYFGVPA